MITGYVIKRIDQGGGYVADMSRSASGGSYTLRPDSVRIFSTREAAERERCPENEIVLDVSALFGRRAVQS